MEGVEESENINEEEGDNEDEFDTEKKEGHFVFLIDSKAVKQLDRDCIRDTIERIVEDGDNSDTDNLVKNVKM